MLNITEKLKESFISDDILSIGKASKYFARMVTKGLMDKNYDYIQKICLEISKLRDCIELDLDLKRDKNYYFGYIYAYENIARRLIEEFIKENDINIIVSQYPKVRKAIMFLGKNQFATQGQIANALKISASYLWNILNKDIIVEANIFVVKKIGRSKIYSLTERGRQYYHNSCDEEFKMYSKKDFKKIINFINSNKVLIDKRNGKIIDDELLIYKMYMEQLDMSIDKVDSSFDKEENISLSPHNSYPSIKIKFVNNNNTDLTTVFSEKVALIESSIQNNRSAWETVSSNKQNVTALLGRR